MEKVKVRKVNYRRVAIVVVVGLIILGLLIFGIVKVCSPKKKMEQKPIQVVDTLEEYGYTLDENETGYYKELFNLLKKELNEKEVNEEEYAKLVSQLFISDFFNLDNKITRNDVGGIQFVYKDYQEDFKKYATTGMYQSIENNLYGDRKQELPVVTNVEVTNLSKSSFQYLGKTDSDCYVVSVTITYEKDLGYQTNAELTLVHVENKLEVVKMENHK